MSKTYCKHGGIHTTMVFLLIIGGLLFILIGSGGAQAQYLPSFFNPYWSPAPSVFSFPFAPFSFSSFYTGFSPINPFLSSITPLGFPAAPAPVTPSASILGGLIPFPPLPVATIAGTTITAPTTITEVELRIWLEGPPLSLVLPVPTTIYIVPQATASGLLIRPPTLPII
ncbi:MAG: hypothetical protein ACMUIS_02585 [bacterium]